MTENYGHGFTAEGPSKGARWVARSGKRKK